MTDTSRDRRVKASNFVTATFLEELKRDVVGYERNVKQVERFERREARAAAAKLEAAKAVRLEQHKKFGRCPKPPPHKSRPAC